MIITLKNPKPKESYQHFAWLPTIVREWYSTGTAVYLIWLRHYYVDPQGAKRLNDPLPF